MGNVAGVGQFLETVAAPGTQAGTQPGTDSDLQGNDFATALQQAGGPSPSEVSVPDQGKLSGEAAHTGSDSSSTNGSPKASNDGQFHGAVQSERHDMADPTQAGRRGVGRGVNAAITITKPSASKQGQTEAGKLAEDASETQKLTPIQPVEAKATPVVSLSGTVKRQIVNVVPLSDASATAASELLASALKTGLESTATAKANQEVVTDAAKSVGKTGVSKAIDVKLTAIVPQEPAGSAAIIAEAATNPLQTQTVIPTLPVVADAATASHTSDNLPPAEPPNASSSTRPSVAPVRGAAIQAQVGKLTATKTLADRAAAVPSATMPLPANTSASAALAPVLNDSNAAVLGGPSLTTAVITTPVPAAPVESATTTGAVTPKNVEAVPSAAGTNLNPVLENAGTLTVAVANGSLEQTSTAFQASVQTAGAAQTPKPALHSARSTPEELRTASQISGPAVANLDGAQNVTTVRPVAFSVAASPITADAAASTAIAAGTAELDEKAGLKPVSLAAAPVQSVGNAGALPPKANATQGASSETAAAKGGADTIQPAAAQPGPISVEPVAALNTAAVPLPITHEATSTSATGGTAAGSAGTTEAIGSRSGTHDAGSVPGLSHATLSATPTSLEVGVSSGTHGWLKIRAELTAAGEVNASLTGGTAAAADKLRAELPALSNYLQGEKVALGVLDVRSALHTVMATGESSATFSQSGSGQGNAGRDGSSQTSQGNASGAAVNADAGSAGGREHQQTPQGAEAVASVSGVGASNEVVLGRTNDTAGYGSSMELDDNAEASSVGYGASGGWLNVRA